MKTSSCTAIVQVSQAVQTFDFHPWPGVKAARPVDPGPSCGRSVLPRTGGTPAPMPEKSPQAVADGKSAAGDGSAHVGAEPSAKATVDEAASPVPDGVLEATDGKPGGVRVYAFPNNDSQSLYDQAAVLRINSTPAPPVHDDPDDLELPKPVEGFDRFGHIPLKKVPNARDLGGLPTADGRRIAPHRLIRSGDLHEATFEDTAVLMQEHGMARAVDFRTDAERKRKPAPYEKIEGVTVYDLPVLPDEAVGIAHSGSLADELKAMARMSKNVFEAMVELYPQCLVSKQGEAAYRYFLNMLLEDADGATMFHCTEGKDRTGLGAYLVEYALGVPEDVRVADYLATNLFVRTWTERALDAMARHHVIEHLAADVDGIFYARRAYLDAAVNAACAEYGSLDGYLTGALDFDADKQRKLQEMYLV